MYLQDSAAEAKDALVSSLPLVGAGAVSSPATTPSETVRALCHDLRQPLTALRLMATDTGERSSEEKMTALLEEVNWLATLVDLVLGSPADMGPSDADLAAVVRHAITLAAAGACCAPSLEVLDPVRVQGRGPALERAVLCLLDNAIRAAGQGGHVTVVVSQHGGLGRVVISDDGPGLGRLAPQHSLGLTTVRAILADCQGGFSLRNGDHGGAVVTMEVPRVAWTVAS
ncbi:hypothetical protein GCM10009721_41690 [Terrabacter tumescens]|uniref:histidine kinase n=2 Tax=Terrabacter tumescens TaxID=60443 RepID=A0ABQ2IIL4_9MICO|nr:hypothetical protein GCM10009721_41690 [Terrabacter tumescens]